MLVKRKRDLRDIKKKFNGRVEVCQVENSGKGISDIAVRDRSGYTW